MNSGDTPESSTPAFPPNHHRKSHVVSLTSRMGTGCLAKNGELYGRSSQRITIGHRSKSIRAADTTVSEPTGRYDERERCASTYARSNVLILIWYHDHCERYHFTMFSSKTVYAMANAGEIPAFKIRGQWRITRAELDKWTEVQPRGGEGDRSGE